MADDDKTQEERDAENLEKFMASITPKLTESILASVSEKVETQISGVFRKNRELLNELRDQRTKGQTPPNPNAPIVLAKEDARDPQKYRAARERAAKAGVALHIEGRHETA
jgi:hypothetical protein